MGALVAPFLLVLEEIPALTAFDRGEIVGTLLAIFIALVVVVIVAILTAGVGIPVLAERFAAGARNAGRALRRAFVRLMRAMRDRPSMADGLRGAFTGARFWLRYEWDDLLRRIDDLSSILLRRRKRPTSDGQELVPSDPPIPLGSLRHVGPNEWESAAGLRYVGLDPQGRNRVLHVLRHADDDPARGGDHGVFDAGRRGALAIVDEAWQIARRGDPGVHIAHGGGRERYTVPMGRRIGYVGGQGGAARGNPPASHVFIIIENGNEVITAFPIVVVPPTP